MRSSAPSLIATATATKTCVFANALESCRRAIRFLLLGPSWLPGIFRVQQLHALDFIGSGNPYGSRTRNIPELGISESIPLTEYFPFRARTPSREPRERNALLMLQREFIRVRSDPRRRRYLANPLWPLEELHDLRNPPFVADPEFTPFDIYARSLM